MRWTGGAVAAGSLFAELGPLAGKAAGAPGGRQQLVVAQDSDIVTLDPAMYRQRNTQNVHQLLYDSLIHREATLKLVGRLAESWEVVDDRTYRFKMRKTAKFHDGKPVSSKDVKFSYDRTLDPALKAPRAGLLDMVASTEAPDDATLIVRTKSPDPLTPVFLNYHAILPRAAEAQGAAFFDHPIGAGPFQFVQWMKGEQIVLKAFHEYWEGAPPIETLIIRSIPDPAAMIAELESGGVDIVPILPPQVYDQVKSNPKLRVLTTPSTLINYVGLNTRKKPLDNVAVRQALNLAVDKAAIIKNILHTLAVPIPGPFFPEMRGFDRSLKGYPFDPARAKSLLKEASLETGFDIGLDTTANYKEASEALAGQLGQIGVRVTVNVMENGVLRAKYNRGDSAMYFSEWGDSTADGGATLYRHFSSSQLQVFKDTGYSRPDLDRFINEGRTSLDFNKRQTLFAQAARTIVNDAPWIFLWQPKAVAATGAGIRGFVPRADAYLFLNKVTKT